MLNSTLYLLVIAYLLKTKLNFLISKFISVHDNGPVTTDPDMARSFHQASDIPLFCLSLVSCYPTRATFPSLVSSDGSDNILVII
jgi:hypothetical protein